MDEYQESVSAHQQILTSDGPDSHKKCRCLFGFNTSVPFLIQ